MRLNQLALLISSVLAVSACDSGGGNKTTLPDDVIPTLAQVADPTVDSTAITLNDYGVHDPSVIKVDNTYYIFGSHLGAAKSTDLMNWSQLAEGDNFTNGVLFSPSYAEALPEAIEWTGGYVGSWASDVIQLADGKFYFYYNHCTSPVTGECNAPSSYLGVAVSDSIEGPYVDQGVFLRSGLTTREDIVVDPMYITATADDLPEGVDAYIDGQMPNVIDPDVFHDKNGGLWMTYGSHFGGIWILEMDETTAMPKPGQGYGKRLTGGNFYANEGSYVLYSPESDYYYLFTSLGGFNADGGYNIRISRSRTPDGPYLDSTGFDMTNVTGDPAEHGVKLMGGFEFTADLGSETTSEGYLSPGHNSAYYDQASGKHVLITHTRFTPDSTDYPGIVEAHSVRVHEMFVNADGWLVASPHRYVPIDGDNVVDALDLVGDYRFINHELDTNRSAKKNLYISLTESREITGDVTGSYRLFDDNPERIVLTIAGKKYEGVLAWQYNDSLGKLVPTFSALSGLGESVWGTKQTTKTNNEVLTSAADALILPDTYVGDALHLETKGTRGATISWASDNKEVIATDGTIYPPSADYGDQTVILTASITRNGETITKELAVTIPALKAYNRTAKFSFDDNLIEGLGNFEPATMIGDKIGIVGGNLSYVEGVNGQAVYLDGASAVLLPDSLISNYQYTVSFWMKPTVITGFTPGFFGAASDVSWLSFLPQSWDGNTMLWSGTAWFDGSTGERIPENVWTHMAFSVDNGFVKVYLDGVEKYAGGTIADLFSSNVGTFTLGANYWDIPFNGAIDDLKIYEAALSAEEVKALDIDNASANDLVNSAISLLEINGDLSNVKADLDLPIYGPYGSGIRWASSDSNYLSVDFNKGIVTQPERDESAAQVTLTATMTLDGVSVTKDFSVTVANKAAPEPIAVFSFEDDFSETLGNFEAGYPVAPGVVTTTDTVEFVDGLSGKAVSFAGGFTPGVRLPDNLITDHTYTISVWLNPTVLNNYTTTFFAYTGVESGANGQPWMSIIPKHGERGTTEFWTGGVNNTGTTIPVGQWSHILASVNAGTMTMYINGELVETANNFPDFFSNAEGHFTLGTNIFDWDATYNGLIDEVKIYNESINADDAAAFYAEFNGQ